MNAIFCIGILDFTFDNYRVDENKEEVMHTVKLKDQNGNTFYDKLTFIYIEIPNFNKTENALDNRLEKWLYFLKHLEDFQSIPTILKDNVFKSAFQTAEIAKFNQNELEGYENSLKVYRDLKGVIDTAREDGIHEGIEKGIEKEKLEVAKIAKSMGMKIGDIIKLTGLSQNEFENI